MLNSNLVVKGLRLNSLLTTKESTGKTTFSQLLCHSGLSRILLLSERFPTTGNDNHEALLMNLLVTVIPFNLQPVYYCNLISPVLETSPDP
jgi:hypothetical protein